MLTETRSGRIGMRRRAGTGMHAADARWGLTLSLPTTVIIFVIVILPVLWTTSLAFQHVTLLNIRSAGFIGVFSLSNFRRVINQPGFYSGIIATLAYSVFGTLLSVSIGLAAALGLRKTFRGRSILRSAMLLPYVAPIVAVTYVWQIMLSPTVGLINQIAHSLFGSHKSVPFLSQQAGHLPLIGSAFTVPTALISVILFDAWRYFPFAFLFFTARIQALAPELEEAGRVDGATVTQRFRHIIFPQLRNVLLLLVVLRFIWTFNKFDDVYLLTGGAGGTQVVSIRVYQFLTAYQNVGESSAEALLLAVVLAIFGGVYAVMQAKTKEA